MHLCVDFHAGPSKEYLIFFLFTIQHTNLLPSRLVCQKYVRKRKGAVKTRLTVLKMRITCKQKCDQNLYALCFMECAQFRLQS